jgi:opacity protein-like surface antigen
VIRSQSTALNFGCIDAPEKDQLCLDGKGSPWTCGIEARDRLVALVVSREVRFDDQGADNAYPPRRIGICSIEGEIMSLNQRLVRDGWAKTNVGFSVGAGMEGKLGFLPANWAWKLEYLYVDLGSLDAVSSFNAGIPATFPNFTTAAARGTTALHTHFTDNIVRVGLNYKFGSYYAPVVTK